MKKILLILTIFILILTLASCVRKQPEPPVHTHKWDGGTLISADTCGPDAQMLFTCVECGETYTEKAEIHSLVAVGTISATCTDQGYTQYKCEHCGYDFDADFTDPNGHSYGPETALSRETCTESGRYQIRCATCGDVHAYTKNALGHHFELISTDVSSEVYECDRCLESYTVTSAEELLVLTGTTELFGVEPSYTFNIVAGEHDEAYIREHLFLIDSYFNTDDYKDHPEVAIAYLLTYAGEGVWTLSFEGYEYDTTYIAELEGGLTFADFKSKKLAFTITEDPSHENDYGYSEGIIFLNDFIEQLPENLGGNYPYSLGWYENGSKLYLTINTIDGINRGNIICIGDISSVEEITSSTECYFGVVENINKLQDGNYMITLGEPELQQIFKSLDIAFNQEVSFENQSIDFAKIEKELVGKLYSDKEFIEFLSTLNVAADKYANDLGYVTELSNVKYFMERISLIPEVSFVGNTMNAKINGSLNIPIKDSGDNEIGYFDIRFAVEINSKFEIDVSYKIKAFGGAKLDKFDVSIKQTDTISFDFNVSVNMNGSKLEFTYVRNKNTGLIHNSGCVHVVNAESGAKFEEISAQTVKDILANSGFYQCSQCRPTGEESASGEAFKKYYIDTLYYSDWSNVANEIGEWVERAGDSNRNSVGVNLIEIEIPICGPISVDLGLDLVIGFDIKAALDYNYSYEQVNFYGMRLNGDGVQKYVQREGSTVLVNDFSLLGTAEIRTGLLVDVNVNISGLEKWLHAGLSANVGAYATISGLLNVSGGNYTAAYFESGAYLDINAYYKVIKNSDEINLGSFKWKVNSYGYEKVYYSYQTYLDSITISGSYDIAANDLLKVEYLDLKTMKTKFGELSPMGSSLYTVKYKFNTAHLTVENGVIKVSLTAPDTFEDTLVITIESNASWDNYVKNSAAYYIGIYVINLKVINNHKHTQLTAPTCEYSSKCKECGTSVGEPLPHEFMDATCQTPKKCMYCTATEGDVIDHDWTNPTCTERSYCTMCGTRTGDILGHKWNEATDNLPEICDRCGVERCSAEGHVWANATCLSPMTCSRANCGETRGEALGHIWGFATCTSPKTCTRVDCGATSGEALGHNWVDATCQKAKHCTRCNLTDGNTIPCVEGDWVVSTPATTIQTGEKYTVCIMCGNKMTSEKIPMLTSEGLEYKLNSDGKSYTIIGMGTCKDVHVSIPSTYNGYPVTAIDSLSFAFNSTIKSVRIPNSVTSIGASAFFACSNISQVIIPNSMTSIGDSAFSLCENLKEITIQSSLTSIGKRAFYGCKNLTKINYNGTLNQWNAISKGDGWYLTNGASAKPNLTVSCKNGNVDYKN